VIDGLVSHGGDESFIGRNPQDAFKFPCRKIIDGIITLRMA